MDEHLIKRISENARRCVEKYYSDINAKRIIEVVKIIESD